MPSRSARRVLRASCIAVPLVLFGLIVVLCALLAGCKDPVQVTETIYTQEAEEVDYDNSTKIYVQTSDAEETTDLLPALDAGDENPDDAEEALPDSADGDDAGEAPDEELDEDDGDDGASTDDGGTTLAQGGSGDEDDGDDSGEDDDGEEDDDGGEVGDPDFDEGFYGESGDVGGTEGARSGGTQLYYSSSGEHEDVPTGIDYVAAVGEAATIVSMLAGDSGALLYTDASWASRDNLQEVLGSKYNDDVTIAWDEDGDSYDLSDEALQQMIDDERLECVFVISGSRTLTEDQEQQLNDAGIVVSYLPDLNTAADIKEAVLWVGAIFAAGDEGNEAALELAQEYVSFHDDLVAEVSQLAGTQDGDEATGAPVASSTETLYTLYISGWVDDVEYVDASAGIDLDTSNGIGITTLGYQWSPLAYYMSVAGAVNTASESLQTSGTTLVWQFNTNHIPATEASFSRTGLVSSYQTNSGNTAYGWTYLCSSDFKGVGTEYFPYVIVNSQASQAKMEADKASEGNSLYKIYGVQRASTGSVNYIWVGPMRSAEVGYVGYSVSGLVQAQSSTQNLDTLSEAWDAIDYEVVVNPCGLFESWTDGTVESVLECAWISWLYRGGDDPAETIRDFYETFYGYELSDDEIQTILEGPVE